MVPFNYINGVAGVRKPVAAGRPPAGKPGPAKMPASKPVSKPLPPPAVIVEDKPLAVQPLPVKELPKPAVVQRLPLNGAPLHN